MEFYKNLSASDWAKLLPVGIACAAAGYGAAIFVEKKFCGGGKVNPNIRKEESKVVDSVDIEDIGKQAAFCRCWRSSKFPYCDGSHNKHNEDCGDNVGPVLIKKKDK